MITHNKCHPSLYTLIKQTRDMTNSWHDFILLFSSSYHGMVVISRPDCGDDFIFGLFWRRREEQGGAGSREEGGGAVMIS